MMLIDTIVRKRIGGRTAFAEALTYSMKMLALWYDLARSRRHLAELPEYLFKDVGLSRESIQREANRPFWETSHRPYHLERGRRL